MRTVLLIAALALMAAPAVGQTKAPAAKTPAPKPAAKPAPKPAFDARDPNTLVTLLAGMDAKAEVGAKTETSVALKVTTPGGGFGMQFVDCDAKGKACQGVAFSTSFERKSPNLAQLNMFNRTQIACRGFLTDDGKSHVMYSAMLTSRTNAEEMRQHIGVWQGCLSLFGQFNADPVRFLARS
jgi:hypothetical protein